MSADVDRKAQEFYATLLDREAIQAFVRNRLGCQCEEKVFEQIVIGVPSIFPGAHPGWDLQILIGFRLLVSLVAVEKLNPLDNDIYNLLQTGKELRDRQGLNRFRLVLLGRLDQNLYASCQQKAQQFDDRIHLHVLEV
jgi:hypothetical protein